MKIVPFLVGIIFFDNILPCEWKKIEPTPAQSFKKTIWSGIIGTIGSKNF